MRSLDGQALNGVLRGEFEFKGLVVRSCLSCISLLHTQASTHAHASAYTHR